MFTCCVADLLRRGRSSFPWRPGLHCSLCPCSPRLGQPEEANSTELGSSKEKGIGQRQPLEAQGDEIHPNRRKPTELGCVRTHTGVNSQ